MDVQCGQMVVNPTFDDWIYENDIPPLPFKTSRQMTYRVEDTDPTGTNNGQQIQHNYQGTADYVKIKPTGRSNRSVLMLMSIVCLMSFVIFVLILLMSVGKIMKGCDCSLNEASPSMRRLATGDILARITALEGNVTNLQLRLEEKTNELKAVRSSLPQLEEKFNNISLKLNATAEDLETNEKKFHAHIRNVTSSIIYMTDELKNDLDTTRNHLIASDVGIRDSLTVFNSTLTLKVQQLDSNIKVVHSLANDTKMKLIDFKKNTKTSSALAEAELQVLRTDLNSTRSTLQDVDVELQKYLTAVNTTLMARSDSLDSNMNQLSSILATTRNNFKKLNETLLNTTLEFRDDLSSLTSSLNSTNKNLKSSIENLQNNIEGLYMNCSSQVYRLDVSMTTVRALVNETGENFSVFSTNTKSALLSVNTGLNGLEGKLNLTRHNLAIAISETDVKLNSTRERLDKEDVKIRTLLNDINITLSLKVENLSKLQGPIGPRGFNGTQGPIGPAGPTGFNGTQGPQGVMGPQGFNGSQGQPGPQGAQGAGDFLQCEHKTNSLSGSLVPVTSNILGPPVKVIKGEPSGKKIVGVSCTADIAQLYLLATQINPANNQLFYYCNCYGHHGSGSVPVVCTMHYWECPLTT